MKKSPLIVTSLIFSSWTIILTRMRPFAALYEPSPFNYITAIELPNVLPTLSIDVLKDNSNDAAYGQGLITPVSVTIDSIFSLYST